MSQVEVARIKKTHYDYTYHLLAKGATMPNWCSNSLHIKGDRQQLRDFQERVTKTNDDGNVEYAILPSLYPTPTELREAVAGHFTPEPNENWAKLLAEGEITQEWYDELVERNRKGYAIAQENIAKYGYSDWYGWCVDKWGTKWGDCDTVLHGDASDGSLDFTFESAWSPPVDGIIHISTMFPDLVFMMSWAEEGMDFYGGMAVKNGTHKLVEGEISALDDYKEIDWDSESAYDDMDTVHEAIMEAREASEIKAVQELGVKL